MGGRHVVTFHSTKIIAPTRVVHFSTIYCCTKFKGPICVIHVAHTSKVRTSCFLCFALSYPVCADALVVEMCTKIRIEFATPRPPLLLLSVRGSLDTDIWPYCVWRRELSRVGESCLFVTSFTDRSLTHDVRKILLPLTRLYEYINCDRHWLVFIFLEFYDTFIFSNI
jgi:hypothetical protein